MVHWASNGTFIWLLSNVAFYHYARWRDSIAEQMDLAIVTMLLTVKLTSLVHFQLDNLIEKFKVLPDNKSPKFSTPGQTENNCLASLQKLDAADKARHRYQKLGLFEFISYIFFFPGLTTGPVPTLPEFRAFLMQSIPKHFELEQLKISIKSLVLGIILTLSWNFLKPYINENIYLERYLEIPFYQK